MLRDKRQKESFLVNRPNPVHIPGNNFDLLGCSHTQYYDSAMLFTILS